MELQRQRTATRLAIVCALAVVVACALGTPGARTGAYAAASPQAFEPSWQEVQVALPTAALSTAARLNAISAISSREIWAVGSISLAGAMQPLVEQWDGKAWHFIPSSNSVVSSADGTLYGVYARASNDVWAVGTTNHGTSNLLMHWDGQKWTASPNLLNSSFANEMHGVLALSADDAWAVGWGGQPSAGFTAAAFHWDGTRWQPVSPPHSGARNDYLYALTGQASNDVWAVGYSTDYRGRPVGAYMAHWNGISWSLSQSLITSSPVKLYAATEIAPDNVWAVGRYGDKGSSAVLHYDGRAWTAQAIPAVSECLGNLRAVAGTSSRDLWVAGYQQCGATKQRASLYQDGSGWSARLFTGQSKSDSEILGIALVKDKVWVVGYFNGPFAAYYPLIYPQYAKQQ